MSTPPEQAQRTALPVIRLDPSRDGQPPGDDWLVATLRLRIGGEPHELEILLPPGPTRPRELLRVFEGLTNVVVDMAVREVEQQGRTISCRAGCGACCRQMVPLTAAEAHRIAELLAALPEPRRSVVQARFEAARQRFAEAGLLEQLQNAGAETSEQRQALGLAYFRLGVACPFLEDESCSIHPDRPLACREYLVTSPAENCARPTPETVHCVEVPSRVSAAVREMEKAQSPTAPGWVPLILAPAWAAAHPEAPASRTAPELLEDLFARLTGRTLTPAAPPPG
jgi:Fe-S-cluster containining protein